MATKTKKTRSEANTKGGFNVSQLIRDAKKGKVAEPQFKSALTKHYHATGQKDDWIAKRVKHLARQIKK